MKKNLEKNPVCATITIHSGAAWDDAVKSAVDIEEKIWAIVELKKALNVSRSDKAKELIFEGLEVLRENEEFKLRMLYKKLAARASTARDFLKAISEYKKSKK